jgi:hypothetical protein
MDLKAISQKLTSLAGKKPSEDMRNYVFELSSCKHEGIQVCVAKVLSSWGDKKSVDLLRDMLDRLARLPHRWSAVGAVARELSKFIDEDDIRWLIPLYLRDSSPRNRFVLLCLFEDMSNKVIKKQLQIAVSEGCVDKRDVTALSYRIGVKDCASLYDI